MTLKHNPKLRKEFMKRMSRSIKDVEKIYKTRHIMATLTDEQKEKSWQAVFNQNKIIEQLAVFENNNEYLTLNATYLAIMAQYKYQYLKWISVMPNIDWYYYKDERNTQNNDRIQCIFGMNGCPHKDKPICFMVWVPSNKPHVKLKYERAGKSFYNDRAYVMALCDIHNNKCMKDNEYIMDFMTDNILPLRKYEDKNGFVVMPKTEQTIISNNKKENVQTEKTN